MTDIGCRVIDASVSVDGLGSRLRPYLPVSVTRWCRCNASYQRPQGTMPEVECLGVVEKSNRGSVRRKYLC